MGGSASGQRPPVEFMHCATQLGANPRRVALDDSQSVRATRAPSAGPTSWLAREHDKVVEPVRCSRRLGCRAGGQHRCRWACLGASAKCRTSPRPREARGAPDLHSTSASLSSAPRRPRRRRSPSTGMVRSTSVSAADWRDGRRTAGAATPRWAKLRKPEHPSGRRRAARRQGRPPRRRRTRSSTRALARVRGRFEVRVGEGRVLTIGE